MNTLIANSKLAAFSAIVLGLTLSVSAPHAQGQSPRVGARIPFDFQVGSEHVEAGRYIVAMDSTHFVRLQGNGTATMSLARAEINRQPSPVSKLVFRRLGNRYFLREVWMADQSEHQVLPRSKAEKRQQNALNATERDGIEIALLEPIN